MFTIAALTPPAGINAMYRLDHVAQRNHHPNPLKKADAAKIVHGNAQQQRVVPDQIGNGAMPPQKLTLVERINALFAAVCKQDATLKMPAAKATSCTRLPPPTGPADSVEQVKENAVDCLIVESEKGQVAIIDAADPWKRGGGVGVDDFRHENIPQEETLFVLGLGAKNAVDRTADSYPLGSEGDDENQLYIPGLRFRHDSSVLKALRDVDGSGRARLAAQRDLLLDATFSASPGRSPTWDMICVSAPDRRDNPDFDPDVVDAYMFRQIAHAMLNARNAGAKMLILSLPGSDLFSRTSRAPGAKADPIYLDALAAAAARAINSYGAGLRIVIPSHGRLDERVHHYREHPKPLPPMPKLLSRKMGRLNYQVETVNLAKRRGFKAHQALRSLIGDGSKVTLRRVHGITPPAQGQQPYWFIGRDPDPRVGRALVSIQIGPGRREVHEVVYSLALRPLAEMANHARTLLDART